MHAEALHPWFTGSKRLSDRGYCGDRHKHHHHTNRVPEGQNWFSIGCMLHILNLKNRARISGKKEEISGFDTILSSTSTLSSRSSCHIWQCEFWVPYAAKQTMTIRGAKFFIPNCHADSVCQGFFEHCTKLVHAFCQMEVSLPPVAWPRSLRRERVCWQDLLNLLPPSHLCSPCLFSHGRYVCRKAQAEREPVMECCFVPTALSGWRSMSLSALPSSTFLD